MSVQRYYYMELDPESGLANSPMGGAMLNAAYDEGLEFFRSVWERDGGKDHPDAFKKEWSGLDILTLEDLTIQRGLCPCEETMTLIRLLSHIDNKDMPELSFDDNITTDDLWKLSDDMWSAFRRGLWAGYEDLMEEIGGVKEDDPQWQ